MITNSLGHSFPNPVIAVGILISTIGLLFLTIFLPSFILVFLPLGILISAVGAFFWSSTYGFQLDTTTNNFREYGSVYGIKRGEWKSLDKYPFITVLKSRMGATLYTRNHSSITLIEDAYEITLLSSTHRTKVVVQKFKKIETAKINAEKFASEFDKEIVKFNPQVSEATMKRRRMRRR